MFFPLCALATTLFSNDFSHFTSNFYSFFTDLSHFLLDICLVLQWLFTFLFANIPLKMKRHSTLSDIIWRLIFRRYYFLLFMWKHLLDQALPFQINLQQAFAGRRETQESFLVKDGFTSCNCDSALGWMYSAIVTCGGHARPSQDKHWKTNGAAFLKKNSWSGLQLKL